MGAHTTNTTATFVKYITPQTPQTAMNTKKQIMYLLALLENAVPVSWDRYTMSDVGAYNIYGWIKRSDNERDFLLLQIINDESGLNVGYVTSSAKYTKEIGLLLFGENAPHNTCTKIEQLIDDAIQDT